jgi:hypothetical protein
MAVKRGRSQAAKARLKRRALIDLSAVPLARKAAFAQYAPQLATLVRSVPSGPGWMYEAKFDGYRLMAHRDGERVRLLSRRGLDWGARFKGIVQALGSLPASSFVIDGEACALDDQGRPSFQLLQNHMERGAAAPMAYFAFDLLYADGYDLAAVPLIERKQLLQKVVAGRAPKPRLSTGCRSRSLGGGWRPGRRSGPHDAAGGLFLARIRIAARRATRRPAVEVECAQHHPSYVPPILLDLLAVASRLLRLRGRAASGVIRQTFPGRSFDTLSPSSAS